ncbi:MAG TPA: polysialyltransferase family glycosyltransferase, partial [Mesotoga sp.]|nr:polysialyltransferase family glycosyltransferase [Mesotoga sp.]
FSHLTGDFSSRYSNSKSIGMLSTMVSSLLNSKLPMENEILAISANTTRREFEGSEFDIYIDWIGKLTEHSYSIIEIPNVSVPNPRHNVFTKQRISGMNLLTKSLIKAKSYQKRADGILSKITNLLKGFLDSQGIEDFIASIRKVVPRYLALISLMEDMLDRLTPKLVLEVCSYNLSSRALTYAAKLRGIPVAEIQHGIINRFHAGYIYRHVVNRSDTPDELLVYGQAFKEVLTDESVLFKPESIHVVGNYYIESVKNQPTIPEVQVIKNDSKDKQVALITTQPIYEAKAYAEAVTSLGKKGYFVIIKPHPSELKEKYFAFQDRNVIVSTFSVFELLKIADIHLTISSTCALDALQYSVPSVVLRFEDHQKHLEALRGFSGVVFQERSVDEAIDFCSSGKLTLSDDKFMANGSADRLVSVLNSLLKDKSE